MPDLTPEEIAGQQFRTRFRGLDPDEVRAFLTEVEEALGALSSERDRLRARLGDFADRDLRVEFEAVGREVGAVLEAARQAAEAMRERAAAETARWRSEALAESERQLRAARDDAEQLRGDAWTAAEELLVQAMQEAERMTRDAEAEALRLVGEGERESHRLQAVAKREVEDLIRNTRMEADRLTMAAQADYDAIISSARKESEAAQERTRALEQRRDELKRELDSVRQSLTLAEGEVEERRDELGLSAPQTVERPEATREVPGRWALGETVRVVRPDAEADAESDEGGGGNEPKAVGFPGSGIPTGPEIRILSPSELLERAQEPAGRLMPGEDFPVFDEDEAIEEFDDLHPSEVSSRPPQPETAGAADDHGGSDDDRDGDPGEADEPDIEAAGYEPEEPLDAAPAEHEAALETEPEEPPDAAPAEHEAALVSELEEPPGVAAAAEPLETSLGQQELFEVEGLFARLRHPVEEAPPPIEPDGEAPPARDQTVEPDVGAPREAVPRQDPFELRERLLLPVTNRALRNLKRQLTDEQNVALEELRLDEAGWIPSAGSIRSRVRADLVVLLAESFAAGHSAAESLVGTRLSRPPTPRHEVADDFAGALANELEHVLADGRASGQGARQLGALVSRVFRAWRTDETERRVQNLSFGSYHEGLVETLQLSGKHDHRFVVSGRGCATCRAAPEADRPDRPPLHPGCGCTLIPA